MTKMNPKYDLKALAGRLAIITGAAEGIGAMLAEGFARNGMDVALLDIQEEAAEANAARLRAATGRDCFAVGVDVSDRDAVMQAAAALQERRADWGMVWINAGVGVGAPLIGKNARAVEWGYGVNALGAIWTAQAFLPPLFAQTGARHIGFTASSAALAAPQAPLTLYAATKHASLGLAEGVRAEAAAQNVPMTILCPGLLNTDIWDAARARPEKFGGPKRMDPAISGQWKEALKPETMWPHIAKNIEAGGGYLTCLPPGDRRADIEERFTALLQSIIVLDEKEGF